jgi:hypothetical protein
VENMEINGVSFSSTTAYVVGNGGNGGCIARIDEDDKLMPVVMLSNTIRHLRRISASASSKLFTTAQDEATRKSDVSIYDHLGTALPKPSIPGNAEIKNVDIGSDGSVFMFGPEGIFEYMESTNSLESRTSYSEEPKTIKVLTRNQIFAVNEQETLLSLYDGLEWRREFSFIVSDNADKLGGDKDVMVMVGPYELILQRNSVGTWGVISPVYGGNDLYDVDGFGGGHYVVVGAGGIIGIRKDNYWCRFKLGDEKRFESVAVSPDHSHAFVVGARRPPGQNETPGVIYKIILNP